MNVIWLPGFSDYTEVLELQQELVDRHQHHPEADDDLILLQHRPVYTIGRTRDHSSLHDCASLPHPVHEINRGGQATYHGPGQLVGYPITDLNRMGRDLHVYIGMVEETLIDTCRHYGVEAGLREGLVGIWVEDRKLASIGVGVRKWVTMHGFAINLARESLPPFLSITPCGLQGVRMTCLEFEVERIGGHCPESLLEDFGNRFAALWEKNCLRQRRLKDNEYI